MDLGVVYWATDQTIEPADFAVAVEERGFESCFVGEHTHVPTTWKTADTSGLPDHDGSEPPLLGSPEYKRFLDPFVALSVAAAATTRIQLGTSVCLVAQHDPILLAKTVATLDHLSRGRVILGIGFGWNEREMANHRIDFRLRHAIVREKVAAMRRLWSDEVASYEGRYVSISPSWSWPKPVRQIPVLIGGDGPVAIRHAVEYGEDRKSVV